MSNNFVVVVFVNKHAYTVKEDTLLDMVEYMTSKVGLVHQLPFTCDREGFAATFEKVIITALFSTSIHYPNQSNAFEKSFISPD